MLLFVKHHLADYIYILYTVVLLFECIFSCKISVHWGEWKAGIPAEKLRLIR